jgi:hypothetical protein
VAEDEARVVAPGHELVHLAAVDLPLLLVEAVHEVAGELRRLDVRHRIIGLDGQPGRKIGVGHARCRSAVAGAGAYLGAGQFVELRNRPRTRCSNYSRPETNRRGCRSSSSLGRSRSTCWIALCSVGAVWPRGRGSRGAGRGGERQAQSDGSGAHELRDQNAIERGLRSERSDASTVQRTKSSITSSVALSRSRRSRPRGRPRGARTSAPAHHAPTQAPAERDLASRRALARSRSSPRAARAQSARGCAEAIPDVFPAIPEVRAHGGVADARLDAILDPRSGAPAFTYRGHDRRRADDPGLARRHDRSHARQRLPFRQNQINAVNIHFHGLTVSPNAPGDDTIMTLAAASGRCCHTA